MKPEPITRDIEVVLGVNKHFVDPSLIPGKHASLYSNIEYDAVVALTEPGWYQDDFYRVGTNQGLIEFKTLGGNAWRSTSLIGGADGITNYLKVTATYTAPEATTVVDLTLIATKYYRIYQKDWSIDAGVNQALLNGQDYIINWTIRADI